MDELQLATPTHQKAYDLVRNLLFENERVPTLTRTGAFCLSIK